MKKKLIYTCLVGLLLLSGCSAQTKDSDTDSSSVASEVDDSDNSDDVDSVSDIQKEESEMTPEINTTIMDLLKCNEFESYMITDVLSYNGLTLVESIQKDPDQEDNSLLIVSDGTTYAVGVDLKYGVYSIKNMSTDEYIYAVYE